MTATALITLAGLPAFIGLVACGEARAFGVLWGWVPGQRFYRFVDACIATSAAMMLGGMIWTVL